MLEIFCGLPRLAVQGPPHRTGDVPPLTQVHAPVWAQNKPCVSKIRDTSGWGWRALIYPLPRAPSCLSLPVQGRAPGGATRYPEQNWSTALTPRMRSESLLPRRLGPWRATGEGKSWPWGRPTSPGCPGVDSPLALPPDVFARTPCGYSPSLRPSRPGDPPPTGPWRTKSPPMGVQRASGMQPLPCLGPPPTETLNHSPAGWPWPLLSGREAQETAGPEPGGQCWTRLHLLLGDDLILGPGSLRGSVGVSPAAGALSTALASQDQRNRLRPEDIPRFEAQRPSAIRVPVVLTQKASSAPPRSLGLSTLALRGRTSPPPAQLIYLRLIWSYF